MSILLPPIFPDEVLAGYVLRLQTIGAIQAHRESFGELFGSRWRTVDWWLPGALLHFSEATACLTQGIKPDYWLNAHTLFPYFASSCTLERRCALKNRMLLPQHGPIRPVVALTAQERFSGLIRYCPMCHFEDLKSHGFTYARRAHQLPYVTRCLTHGMRLFQTAHWPIFTSGAYAPAPKNTTPETELSIRFAVESVRALMTTTEISLSLKDSLATAGFITVAGSLRRKALAKSLRTTWGAGFDESYLTSILTSETSMGRMLASLETRRRSIHPVIAALVQGTCNQHTSPENYPRPNKHQIKGENIYFNERLQKALTAFCGGQKLTKAAGYAEVSISSLSVALQHAGLAVPSRPKRLVTTLRKQIISMLCEGLNPQKVALELKVSLSSVYRCRASTPQLSENIAQQSVKNTIQCHRTEWSSLLKQYPQESITQIRARKPGLYAWLYRHDHAWAIGQSRPHTSRSLIHPKRIVFSDFIPHLRGVAETIRDRAGKPVRVTWARTLLEAGLTKSAQHHFSSQNGIAISLETLEQFIMRRIVWSVSEIARSGHELYVWRVERMTSLRPHTIKLSKIDIELVLSKEKRC